MLVIAVNFAHIGDLRRTAEVFVSSEMNSWRRLDKDEQSEALGQRLQSAGSGYSEESTCSDQFCISSLRSAGGFVVKSYSG